MRFHSLQIVALLGSLAVGVAARAADAVPPADAGVAAATPLQAIFMEVDGKVRWRPDEKAAWKEAAVNDLVSAGAEIRTGLKGRATLRVGRNATVLVDSGTSFEIPEMVQEGETLRTLAAVKTGRVDFKVDKVGYANDFKVATPQTTLSVRGTGFAVNSGQLNGVEVVGARTNMINAIELKYVASNLKYFMSGGASSSSSNPDPVKSAWMSSLGPPQVAGLIADKGQLEQMASQGQAGNAPTNSQQAQQIVAAESQQQAEQDNPQLTRLLDLQDSDFRRVKILAKEVTDDTSAEEAHAAALVRSESFGEVYALQNELETDHDALQELVTGSTADLDSIRDLRSELDLALEDEDEVRGEADVVAALDAMGEIDDAWQTELRAQALSLVASVQSLGEDLQAAGSVATSADANFSALRDTAEARLSALSVTAKSLESLRGSIAGYRRAAAQLISAGKVSESALRSLERSLEILNGTSERVTQALAALDAATARLADAGLIADEAGTLQAAMTAVTEGLDLSALSPALQAAIDQNVSAIESARFDAFFVAAQAGDVAINEKMGDAIVSGALSEGKSAQAIAAVDDMEVKRDQTIALAQAMDAFWNTPGSGGEIPAKVRMQSLLERSVEDRDVMIGLLGSLDGSIAASNQSEALQKLDSMRSKYAEWDPAQGGFMQEVVAIDDEMGTRLGSVQAAFGATSGRGSDYGALLAAAQSSRDESAAAVARIEQLRGRLQEYQTQYAQLVAQERGGTVGAQQVATAQTLLENSLASYELGRKASLEAAAASLQASSMGERVMLAASAAADARKIAVDLAAASAAIRDQIQGNVDVMESNLAQGESNYNGAFGGDGGGGGPPG